MDADEFDVLPDDNTIDLDAADPGRAACWSSRWCRCADEDCQGLCPTCGANLNEGPCGCEPVSEEETGDEAPPNPFSVLKGFPFEEK